MCGRIALHSTPERLARVFDAVLAAGVDAEGRPRYNVGPTQSILGISAEDPGEGPPARAHQHDQRVLATYRWGLVPSWAKDASIGPRLFNARAETVATKPSFRAAFARRRLAVPADGFYEWRSEQGHRQPYYFHRADGEPLVFAGLWERWRDPSEGDGEVVYSCTIITTEAGEDLAGIHDRMPVVLEPGSLDWWLDPGNDDRQGLEALLSPTLPGTLAHHAVSRSVGNVRNDGPELIEPVDDAG